MISYNYPLIRRNIDNIDINRKISGTDNITVTHQYSNNFPNVIIAFNSDCEINLDLNLIN